MDFFFRLGVVFIMDQLVPVVKQEKYFGNKKRGWFKIVSANPKIIYFEI